MIKQRSVTEAIATYPKRYTAVHYPKNKPELAALKDWCDTERREIVSTFAEPLPTLESIRAALRLDGEVVSRGPR